MDRNKIAKHAALHAVAAFVYIVLIAAVVLLALVFRSGWTGG